MGVPTSFKNQEEYTRYGKYSGTHSPPSRPPSAAL